MRIDGIIMAVLLLFLIVMGLALLAMIVLSIREWMENSNASVVTVRARVVRVRNESSQIYLSNPAVNGVITPYYSESYAVTFQLESGECMRFNVCENTHDLLDKGDTGSLSYQRTWFCGFEPD